MDCIFCQIAAGNIPANMVHQDEHVLAFHDLDPQAPVHVLVIPKRHVVSLAEMGPQDFDLLPHLTRGVQSVAKTLSIWPAGYRVVTNNGPDGGQTVGHLHLHVLGGRYMEWPPG